MMKIAPSILSADFLNLGRDVEMVNRYADLFHLDVMDGTFVPNISFGFPVIEAIAEKAVKPLDIHLMIVNPDKYFERFAHTGAKMISFHLEAARLAGADAGKWLRELRALGVEPGLVINPDIPVEDVYPYLDDAAFILVMSVFAGFGGQKFIEDTYDRVRTLKSEIDRRGLPCAIEVDGGVSPVNAGRLGEEGASILVAGSSVFRAEHPDEAVRSMRNAGCRTVRDAI